MANDAIPCKDLSYDQIAVGDSSRFEKMITFEDVKAFADLTGDHNPLHVDRDYGKRSQFGGNIAHGLLAAGFFSRLVGMHCPGKKSLYVSQICNFKSPVMAGDVVTVVGTVKAKSDALRMVTLKTEIFVGNRVAVEGEAKVVVQS